MNYKITIACVYSMGFKCGGKKSTRLLFNTVRYPGLSYEIGASLIIIVIKNLSEIFQNAGSLNNTTNFTP